MSRLELDEYLQQQREKVDEERWYRSVIERGGFCFICGHPDDPMVMDSHHIAGRNNDQLTIPVCSNCHRHLTHRQRSWPKEYTQQDNPRTVVMALTLRGISDVLLLISRKLRDLSDRMFQSWRK